MIVNAPPQSPVLDLAGTTTDSLTLKLKPVDGDSAPLHGYTLHYKPGMVFITISSRLLKIYNDKLTNFFLIFCLFFIEFGEWETVDVAVDAQKYTIQNLFCGSSYQVFATGYNK